MTYDQIDKMDKYDLVYAFKRMIEIAEEADADIKAQVAVFDDRDEEFNPYGHIGMLEARLMILKGRLDTVIEVVTNR
tara:strand:- start:584 stop:814 length:231 start_codon:yes stop_codon:yes gene_type:complete